MYRFVLILSVVFFYSCGKRAESEKNETPEKALFKALPSKKTGIDFSNILTENDSINYFTYPYIYMGGGVSIGDINNDGLLDVFFTGNMVENKLYLNMGSMVFKDVSETAQIQGDNRWITGTTMADVNGDGFLDIYVSVAGKFEPYGNLLYINNGDLTFTERALEYGVADVGKTTQSTFFDYDRDGDLDLYVANYPSTNFATTPLAYWQLMKAKARKNIDKFYRNDGDRFTEVTDEAGLRNFGLSLSVTVGDFNQDDWPDLYISNDFQSPDYFYFNNGDGTFSEEVKSVTQHTSFYGMGVDVADINNDGLLDIFQVDMTPSDNRRSKSNMSSMNPTSFWQGVNYGMHYQYMQNCLQLNNGNDINGKPMFSDISRLAGVSNTDWSWAPLVADFDNDGWKDIYITNGSRRDINNKDYFNKMKLVDQEELKRNGLKYSQEIPSEKINNFLYKNNADLTFTNVIDDWGLGYIGFSNGVAYGDLDNDGDLDLVVSNVDEASVIFENQVSNMGINNHLRFSLIGSSENNFGLGAKVTVHNAGNIQFQELTLTRGFQSSSEHMIHFGVGNSVVVDSVTIVWPDGLSEVLTNVQSNQLVTIDYSNAANRTEFIEDKQKMFVEITDELNINFLHTENRYDDFGKEPLLPHRMSTFGPTVTVGDVNGDGLDDFFIGGASKQSGELMLQKNDGTFDKSGSRPWDKDKLQEDMGAVFIDMDNDGDLDLYVVSGGNAFESDSENLLDRVYVNTGNGDFVKEEKALPKLYSSGSRVKAADYDNDGDLDLFVGGRLIPSKYPMPANSYILRNESTKEKVKFVNVTSEIAPELQEIGLVTDAVWLDFDNDNALDLVVVGEWMPVTFFRNESGSFVDMTEAFGVEKNVGWWFSIVAEDFDNDGDMDLVAGNLGLNYKYQATEEETFDVYLADYDNSGTLDIVLGYYDAGIQYPVRGRECSSQQVPGIKKKFENYDEFSVATLEDVYTEDDLATSLHYQVRNFASSYIENVGGDSFEVKRLPNEVQFSSVNDIIINDFNGDGHMDLLMAGNLFASEVETTRNDASFGSVLIGDGLGNFKPLSMNETGLVLPFDVKDLSLIDTKTGKTILVANNNEKLQAIKWVE